MSPFPCGTGDCSQRDKARKRIKGTHMEKEEEKLHLFSDDMIIHVYLK